MTVERRKTKRRTGLVDRRRFQTRVYPAQKRAPRPRRTLGDRRSYVHNYYHMEDVNGN